MAGGVLVPPPPRPTAAFLGNRKARCLGTGALSSIEAEHVWRPVRTHSGLLLLPQPLQVLTAIQQMCKGPTQARLQKESTHCRGTRPRLAPHVHSQQRHKGTELLVCLHTWRITGEWEWEPLDKRGTPRAPSSLGCPILDGSQGSR